MSLSSKDIWQLVEFTSSHFDEDGSSPLDKLSLYLRVARTCHGNLKS